MKSIKSCIALVLLSGTLVLTAGCGGSAPPAAVKKATTTDAKPAAPAPAAESKPAEAPAATANDAGFEEMKTTTVTGKADIAGETAPPAAAATPAAPAAPAGATKYLIEPNDDSSILWVGYGGIMGQMNGGFAAFEGSVTLGSADITSAQIELSINMTTIYSNAAPLTTKLKGEEFFSTSKFANAKFVSTGVVKEGELYNVSGNLEILGATRNTTFPATIEVKDGKLHAKAEFLINRNDWGIVYKGTGDNFIKDDVLVQFDILCPAAK